MKKNFVLFAGIFAAASIVGAVHAQTLEPWGEVAGWDVMIDPSLGDGCLIQAEYHEARHAGAGQLFQLR